MINESFFFRDRLPFDRLRDTVLPALIAARAESRRLRIWSAASSTGQEPYSLAMLVKEFAPRLAGWTVEIVASDISNEVTEKARTGLYTQFEVQRGLPIHLLMTHFERSDDHWRIAADLREMVRFQQQNLLDDFSALGRFDVVFLRNVLIYFDQATKADVLKRVAGVLAPDGYLLLGAAETVVGVSDHFQPLADRQGIQWKLADIFIELQAARLLVYKAATRLDKGEDAREDAYVCKYFADEMAFRAADQCMQIHGGIGLTTDLPIEKFWRQQRSFRITEGATEVMKMVIARHVLKMYG